MAETLKGKTALVTGGTRNVGGAITRSLALRGVNVVAAYREKKPKAKAFAAEVVKAGGRVTVVKADITDPDHRERMWQKVDKTRGARKLNILVLSASGDNDDINVKAGNAVITEALPRMAKGGGMVLLLAVFGKYFKDLKREEIADLYYSIGQSKSNGEDAMVARIPELDEAGVSFLRVCPTIVTDTSTFQIMKNRDRTGEGVRRHDAISIRKGLPLRMVKAQVGERVADRLANRHTWKNGDTDLFQDVQSLRSQIMNFLTHRLTNGR